MGGGVVLSRCLLRIPAHSKSTSIAIKHTFMQVCPEGMKTFIVFCCLISKHKSEQSDGFGLICFKNNISLFWGEIIFFMRLFAQSKSVHICYFHFYWLHTSHKIELSIQLYIALLNINHRPMNYCVKLLQQLWAGSMFHIWSIFNPQPPHSIFNIKQMLLRIKSIKVVVTQPSTARSFLHLSSLNIWLDTAIL